MLPATITSLLRSDSAANRAAAALIELRALNPKPFKPHRVPAEGICLDDSRTVVEIQVIAHTWSGSLTQSSSKHPSMALRAQQQRPSRRRRIRGALRSSTQITGVGINARAVR